MRKLNTIIAALAVGLLATTAPPAEAASTADGNWSAGDCGGFVVHIVDSRAFVILMPSDGSWSVVPDGVLTGATVTGQSYVARNGQPVGGTYRIPDVTPGPVVTINFNLGTIRPNPALECRITQTEFFSGGLLAGAIFNSPWTGPYVTHIRAADNTFGPDELGTGYFVQMQGSTLDLKVAGYDASGNPRWYSVRGACVMTANHICLLSGELRLAGVGASLGTVTYELRNNGGALLILPGDVFLPEPQRWLARYRFDRN